MSVLKIICGNISPPFLYGRATGNRELRFVTSTINKVCENVFHRAVNRFARIFSHQINDVMKKQLLVLLLLFRHSTKSLNVQGERLATSP